MVLPLTDQLPTRRTPVVNVALIVATLAVWLFYELPNPDAAILRASFYPGAGTDSCSTGEPWGRSLVLVLFLPAGWSHILGNMLFLAIFGNNVEDAFGRLGYLVFYFAGGFVATAAQTAATLSFGAPAAAPTGRPLVVRPPARPPRPPPGGQRGHRRGPGRHFVLYPRARVLTLVLW